MAKPDRRSLLGALVGLCLAENQGDVMDEVFTICKAIGIAPPEYNEELDSYQFPWEDEAMRDR